MESIAVIGMGCRFPGANNPESFWQILANGVDGITEVPSNRWSIDSLYNSAPGTPGKMNTRWGGFLEEIDRFDANFFGISPREAERIDPQQRLLLEVTWDALENSGIVPKQLAGSNTGVFIGISNSDYGRLITRDIPNLDAYTGTGTAFSVAANRISYTLDLQGPSLAIDTACSSSLVAVHLACQSLQSGESSLCLVGGVNLIISPEATITFSQAQMMAADGRCKTFDAGADGYVRGEGCGIVVLKPLEEAIKDQDNILAVILGSAVNQDGLTNGITAPNGPSQQKVIRQALQNAEVAPENISYIEAHGTGTALGDPVEVRSLKKVLMENRQPQQTCWLGSVKTNIGHLESAAGIASLIKVILALQHQEIPPHINFQKLNPYISLEGTTLKIPTTSQAWETHNQQPRLAGISGFGFGGTNCHLIVQEYTASVEKLEQLTTTVPSHFLLPLSAKTEESLKALASKYVDFLAANSEVSLADICFTASTKRSHFPYRLAVIADSKKQLQEKLSDFVQGKTVVGLVRGKAKLRKKPKIAFLFTGQGSQYVGMGKQLYDTQPTFRRTLDQCNDILNSYLDIDLLKVIYSDNPSDSLIDETAYTQPALFALEYALAQLWISWGIKPAVVMGHSVGEYVAATIGGVFSLEDGLKLIAARGRLMQALPDKGVMFAIKATESQAKQAIQGYESEVSIAAINGCENIVISGQKEAIEAVVKRLEADGVKTKQLLVSHAFHSPLMEPMLTEFKQVAEEINYHRPTIKLISNLTGKEATAEIATSEYWCEHIREPVRFSTSLETLHEQGYQMFVEIGAKPILLGMGRQCLPEDVGIWLPSLRPKKMDWEQMLQSFGELSVKGVNVNWIGLYQDYVHCKVELPTYPFQRQRYWIETEKLSQKKQLLSRGEILHPLLGQKLNLAGLEKQHRFESLIAASRPVYLGEHRVFEKALLPAAAYLEMILAAGLNIFNSPKLVIEDVVLQQGLVLPEDKLKTVQTILNPSPNGVYQFQIFSQEQEKSQDKLDWVLHAKGKIRPLETDASPVAIDLETCKTKCEQTIEVAEHYQKFKQRGFNFGASFQGIQQLWKGSKQAMGQIELPQKLVGESVDYQLHPALLDAALQVISTAMEETDSDQTYLLVGIERLKIYRRPGINLWAIGSVNQIQEDRADSLNAQMTLLSSDGETIATLEGLRVKRATVQTLLGSNLEPITNWLYEVEWRSQARFSRLLPPDYFLTPEEIEQKLSPTVSELVAQSDLDSYGEILTQLEQLSVEYVIQAFKEMGWTYQAGEQFSIESAAQQLKVVSRHQRLFNRLLQMFAEVGILKQTQDQWQVLQTLPEANPEENSQTLLIQHPKAQAELILLNRCASQLSAVLQGTIDPVQLVFPQGDLTTATQLYQDSPAAKMMNLLVQKAITTALEKLPRDRGMRLLEIGAGTGGTTSYILPHLNSHQTEYVFTDIGALFTDKAQEKFQDYPFVRYQTLDIEVDPKTQGFKQHQYDMIVAANVLHATTSMRQTLSYVRELLAPGGILVLLEGTTRQRWIDLIFGLLEGWWKFEDLDLRPNYPLLSPSKWKQLLSESGFSQVVSLPKTEEMLEILSQQAVILGQADETLDSRNLSDPRGWLILADQQGVAQELATQLRSQGQVCTLVFAGDKYQQITPEEFTINPLNPEEFQRLVTQIAEQLPVLYGVVQGWSLEAGNDQNMSDEDLSSLSQLGCGTTLSLVQALIKTGLPQPPRLWLVTQGVQPVPKNNPLVSGIAQSSLWGMGKVIALEHPELKCVRLDLDPNQSVEQQAKALFSEIWSEDKEDQVALRESTRYVARLVRSGHTEAEVPLNFREDGTYLITGGLGGLGLLVARWMVERGVKHLVLVGRSSPSESTQSQLRQLEQAGVQVVVAQADVSQSDSITKVFSDIERSLPPLRGIIHSAAVVDDALINRYSWQQFANALAPKVQGTWNLHSLTKNQPIDFFVLFSSAASILGGPGLASYAAANAFQDTMAYYRRTMNLPAITINWGAIAQTGLEERFKTIEKATKEHREVEINSIPPQKALEALELLMRTNAVEIAVIPIQWSVGSPQYLESSFLSELVGKAEPQVKAEEQGSAQRHELLQRLEEASLCDRESLLIAYIQNNVAKALRISLSQIDLQQPIITMGLDSLMAIELRNQFKKELGLDIPIVKLMEDSSVMSLAMYLSEQLTERFQTDSVPVVDFNKPEALAIGSAKQSKSVINHDDWIEGEL